MSRQARIYFVVARGVLKQMVEDGSLRIGGASGAYQYWLS